MNVTNEQIDALKELINIGVGSGADVLNTMLDSHIQLQVPYLKILLPGELVDEAQMHGSEQLSAINLPFQGSFLGSAELVFPSESASKLITALTNEKTDPSDIDSIRAGALSEVGNIVLNAVMGTISNLLNLTLTYSVPNYIEGKIKDLMLANKISCDTIILLAKTQFCIKNLEIEGDILLFLEVGSFDRLLASLDKFNVPLGEDGK